MNIKPRFIRHCEDVLPLYVLMRIKQENENMKNSLHIEVIQNIIFL